MRGRHLSDGPVPGDKERRRRRAGGVLATLAAAALLAGPLASGAAAETLFEALALAYDKNPALEAARAQVRSADELVPIALSEKRPSVQLFGEVGPEWSRTRSEETVSSSFSRQFERLDPFSVGLEVVQPLYRGGGIDAGVRRAEYQVRAQRAALMGTEQQTILDAVTAYLDVVRDQAVLELNRNNERVLARQLEATQDRFTVGEITRTDVSQAESRLAGAEADRINAEGVLASSRATYGRVVGRMPGTLTQPDVAIALPGSLTDVVALARGNNPTVLQAMASERAALHNISQAESALYPSVDLTGSLTHSENTIDRTSETLVGQVKAQLTIPLYSSGSAAAQVRRAKQDASESRLRIEQARREAEELAVQAWQSLVTARASLRSRVVQVESAEIALEGVRQEALVGSRTVLDVLDAEQELLDARVSQVQAERNQLLAVFTVLSAIGRLTARDLGLDVQYYDSDANYRRTRDRFYGTDIDD